MPPPPSRQPLQERPLPLDDPYRNVPPHPLTGRTDHLPAARRRTRRPRSRPPARLRGDSRRSRQPSPPWTPPRPPQSRCPPGRIGLPQSARHRSPGSPLVGCRLPGHTDSDGQLRASAGWLLEHIGYRPAYKIADGIRCSERRTLTLTAHSGATATGFAQALTELSAQVEIATGIKLRPEPTLVGAWA
ncbi:hypothetical protein AB0A71_04035 [Kitasatospora aureofaciens]|uniref:hypothetical protein n=1 Tax=Kitasatospora aureofaciens TaxID=1894 RepID=UPI0033C14CB7